MTDVFVNTSAPITVISGRRLIIRRPSQPRVTATMSCRGKDVDGTVAASKLMLVRYESAVCHSTGIWRVVHALYYVSIRYICSKII